MRVLKVTVLVWLLGFSNTWEARPRAFVVHHVVALNSYDDSWLSSHGGGDPLTADKSTLGPDEEFWLTAADGGDIDDGDEVVLQTFWSSNNDRDSQALTIEQGDAPVRFAEPAPWTIQEGRWIIRNLDCSQCPVSSGDKVAFVNVSSGRYLTAAGGGGGYVNATATAVGPYERFEVIFR